MILQSEKERSYYYINFVKGIAIFLMLWGHSIQYCAQESFDFFENIAFKTIYSFHMPLFMIISGYLFYFSFQKRDLKELILHRSKPLVWTILACSAFNMIITYGVTSICYDHSIKFLFDGRLLAQYKSLWFLWSVLAASIGVAVICKKIRRLWLQVFLLVLWTVVAFMFPNGILNVYVYPYFVVGFYYARYKERANLIFVKCIKILCVILFPVMLLFYQKRHSIYTTGLYSNEYSIVQNLGIDMFRWAIGFVGCVAALSIIEFIFHYVTLKCEKKLPISFGLSKMGEKSLQMYALSVSLLSSWLPSIYGKIQKIVGFNFLAHNMYLYSFVYTVFIAIGYSFFLYFLIKLMEKTKFSIILFGK